MELVSHIANATFSSLIRTKTKQSKCLKNTAFKQKTFQIVKERTMREASRDHSNSPLACAERTRANMGSSHRAIVCSDKAGNSQPRIAARKIRSWWSQPGSN